MNRRKYIASILSAGIGINIISKYSIQKSIGTDINLTTKNLTVTQEITEKENPKLSLNFDTFKIKEKNYFQSEPLYTIEARTIYNNSKGKYKTLVDEASLDENGNIKDITDSTHNIPLEVPESFKDSFNVTIEFKFTTDNDNIGPFKKSENIIISETVIPTTREQAKEIASDPARASTLLSIDNVSNEFWTVENDEAVEEFWVNLLNTKPGETDWCKDTNDISHLGLIGRDYSPDENATYWAESGGGVDKSLKEWTDLSPSFDHNGGSNADKLDHRNRDGSKLPTDSRPPNGGVDLIIIPPAGSTGSGPRTDFELDLSNYSELVFDFTSAIVNNSSNKDNFWIEVDGYRLIEIEYGSETDNGDFTVISGILNENAESIYKEKSRNNGSRGALGDAWFNDLRLNISEYDGVKTITIGTTSLRTTDTTMTCISNLRLN